MAVTATIARYGHDESSTTNEFCNLNLSGTYTPGGFTINPFQIANSAALGSSPLVGSNVLFVAFSSPSGYIYTATTGTSPTMTIKIWSAPGQELGSVAVPDAVVQMSIHKSRR